MSLTTQEKKHLSIATILVVFLLVCDQWLKVWAVNTLKGHPGYSFLNDVLRFDYAENRGAFLGMGASLPEWAWTWFFVILVSGMLLYCFYLVWFYRARFWAMLGPTLVIAGGLGNLVDRVKQGYVVDYVHMGFGWLRTGILNLADVAITTGVLMIFFLLSLEKKKT